jgi:hypothetical protein
MTTSSRVLLFVGMLAAVSGGAAQSGSSENVSKPPFSLTISAPQDVKVGAPVIVKITLTNTSDHDIPGGAVAMEEGTSIQDFDIKVRDSKGRPLAETEYGMTVRGRSPHQSGLFSTVFALRPLKPGKSRGEKRELSREFDLGRRGKYMVHAEIFDPDSNLLVKSNTITVAVTK